jgi:hypothetical protein
MTIDAYVVPLESGGYRASNAVVGVTVEAATRDDALRKFRENLEQDRQRGCEIVPVALPEEHPLKQFAGIMSGDPIAAEWTKAISEYRLEVDARSAQP